MKMTTTKAQAKKISKAALPTSAQELVPIPQPVDSVAAASRQVVNLVTAALNNPKLDPRRMQAFMDMQMQVIRYQAEVSYNNAMRDCQAAIPQIPANCENKHTKSKYANLEAIDTVIRPILTKHGFSLSSDTEQVGDRHIKVILTVRHIDGHKELHSMVGELDDGGFKGTANKTGIQAAGSSSSYLVRYLIKMIFNVVIVGEDNDGNKNKQAAGNEPDKFANKMHGDGKVIDGEVLPVADGHVLTFHQLKSDLQKLKTQQQRRDHINKHLATIRALAGKGEEDKIQELHALADKGAA